MFTLFKQRKEYEATSSDKRIPSFRTKYFPPVSLINQSVQQTYFLTSEPYFKLSVETLSWIGKIVESLGQTSFSCSYLPSWYNYLPLSSISSTQYCSVITRSNIWHFLAKTTCLLKSIFIN